MTRFWGIGTHLWITGTRQVVDACPMDRGGSPWGLARIHLHEGGGPTHV